MVGARLCKLLTLFCLDSKGTPTGILPRAFSDMPLSCSGTVSSADEEIDAARDDWTDPRGTGELGD